MPPDKFNQRMKSLANPTKERDNQLEQMFTGMLAQKAHQMVEVVSEITMTNSMNTIAMS